MKTVPLNKRGKNYVLIFIKKNLALGMGICNKLKRIVFTIVLLSVLFHPILEFIVECPGSFERHSKNYSFIA